MEITGEDSTFEYRTLTRVVKLVRFPPEPRVEVKVL